MDIILDGDAILNEAQFHQLIGSLFDIASFYGCNIDALWDLLSTDVERPITIVWKHSDASRKRLGSTFDLIISVFDRVKTQDASLELPAKFDYRLE